MAVLLQVVTSHGACLGKKHVQREVFLLLPKGKHKNGILLNKTFAKYRALLFFIFIFVPLLVHQISICLFNLRERNIGEVALCAPAS